MVDTSEKETVSKVIKAPEEGRTIEEATNFSKLDHHIIDCEPQTIPMKELESYPINPQNPSKFLRVGKD